MVVPGVMEPSRVRCGVTAIAAVEHGPCQGDHDTVDAESHLVSTANGQGMAPQERSPPGGGSIADVELESPEDIITGLRCSPVQEQKVPTCRFGAG